MSNMTNNPYGLIPIGHLTGGTNSIRTNGNYTVSNNSRAINKGDAVMYTRQAADLAVGGGYNGKQTMITLYNPIVTLNAAGTPTTAIPENGSDGQAPCGVFSHSEYTDARGIAKKYPYWITNTPTDGSKVRVFIYDDPNIIYKTQLGTFMGSNMAAPTEFLLMPSMQVQTAGWPRTGTAGANPTIENSAIFGSNLMFITGRGPVGAVAGGTGSLSTIELNGVVQNYQDNPLLADQGTPGNRDFGESLFYACPSIAATNTAGGSVVDGTNEYDRDAPTEGVLKFHGFVESLDNVPDQYGQPGLLAPGDYFNTPFLEIKVTINNHVNKFGTPTVVVEA